MINITPPPFELPEPMDGKEWHTYTREDMRAAIAERDARWQQQTEALRTALTEAIELVEGVAEQQMYPDDWYKAPLARLRDAARTKEPT